MFWFIDNNCLTSNDRLKLQLKAIISGILAYIGNMYQHKPFGTSRLMKASSYINDNYVIAEFLRGEWYKPFFNEFRSHYSDLVLNPDINNAQQNQIRKHLLMQIRSPLLHHLPRDIEWQIIGINNDEFSDLRLIREISWKNTFGPFRTLAQAAEMVSSGLAVDQGVGFDHIEAIRKSITIRDFSEKIICIAAGPEGPRTILEGNHRGIAFQMHKDAMGTADHLPKEIILGTSRNMHRCLWMYP